MNTEFVPTSVILKPDVPSRFPDARRVARRDDSPTPLTFSTPLFTILSAVAEIKILKLLSFFYFGSRIQKACIRRLETLGFLSSRNPIRQHHLRETRLDWLRRSRIAYYCWIH